MVDENYKKLANVVLDLGRELAAMNADIIRLESELREAQAELARLRALDTAQRAEHDGAPLN
jgi:chromosome segregation ATPase